MIGQTELLLHNLISEKARAIGDKEFEAFAEGKEAGIKGWHMNSNPYDARTKYGRSWKHGYEQGRDERNAQETHSHP
jgi:hypothetical protein